MIWALILASACSGGPRPFSQSKSIDDSRKERGRDFSTKKDVVTGMVYWDARSAQSISAGANSEIAGATVRFPLDAVERSTLASLGTGATLLTLTTLRLLDLQDTTQLALSRCLYIGSEENIDALIPFEISLPMQNESGVSEESLKSPSVVVAFRQERHDTDPNSRFTGIIPRSQFTIKDGVVKIQTRYFGMYQVFFFDEPLLEERLAKTDESLLLKSDQATLLEIVESPDEIIRDTEMLPPFKLVVKNAAGEPAEKYKGQVTVRVLDESQDLLEGTKSLYATNGEMVFSDLKINKTMNYVQLQFADADGLLVEAEPYSVYEKPATKIRIVTNIATQKAGTKLPLIEVQAINDEGIIDPRFKREISMVIKGGADKATLGGTAKVRASSGVALFNDLTIDKAATGYQLAVSSSKVSGHASNAFEVLPGNPHTIKIQTQPGRVNYQSNIAVTARVEDAYGNPTTEFSGDLTAALSSHSAGASLTGTITVAASAGVAQFSDLRVNQPSTEFKLEITGSGLVPAVTESFIVDPLAATSLIFSVQPSSAQAGSALNPIVKIRALDSGGFVDTNYNSAISLTLNPNPGSASLGGSASGNFVAGEFAASNLSVSAAGDGYRLRATSGSMSIDSDSFNISAPSGGLWLSGDFDQHRTEDGASHKKFCGGSGTSEDPFQVCTLSGWAAMAEYPAAHFVLTANIDLSADANWGECGNIWPFSSSHPLTGRIDGQGFRVLSRCESYQRHAPTDLSKLPGEVDDIWFDSILPTAIVLRMNHDRYDAYSVQNATEVELSGSIALTRAASPHPSCQSGGHDLLRSGDGSLEQPYILCNEQDWQQMISMPQKLHFALGADIDLFGIDACRSRCLAEQIHDKHLDGRDYALYALNIQIDDPNSIQTGNWLLPHFNDLRLENLIVGIAPDGPDRITIGEESICSRSAAHRRKDRSGLQVTEDCQIQPLAP